MDITKVFILFQFGLPVFCSGIIFLCTFFFIYLFFRSNRMVYLIVFGLALCTLVFLLSEALICYFGSIGRNLIVGRQFHRIEQLAASLYLILFPLFMINYLKINRFLHKIMKLFLWGGVFFVSILIVIMFIFPDLFISQTIPNKYWMIDLGAYARGAEGILYVVRDILLVIYAFYFIGMMILDVIKHKNKYVLPVIIGIVITIFFAFDDIIYVHTGLHFGLFPSLHYSRFSLGISTFVILTTITLTREFIDISKEVTKAYQALQNSEEKFTQIANHINEIFWLIDYAHFDFLYVTPLFEKIWQIPATALFSNPDIWINSVVEDDKKTISNFYKKENLSIPHDIEYRIKSKENRLVWIHDRFFPVKDAKGNITSIARLTEDITERKSFEKKLAYMAYFDELTGLPNRKSFYKRFDEVISLAHRSNTDKLRALLFIDIDNFKETNDMLGNEYGDQLLCMVTHRFELCIRKSDILFRMGGDEFSLILTGIRRDTDAAIVSEKILKAFKEPFKLDEHILYLSVSIGISVYPKDGLSSENLVKSANTALTEAKTEKNTYMFHTHSMKVRAQEKIQLINNLRLAMEKTEFVLHFQPLVNFENTIIGAEALIRWYNDDNGSISPAKFIPIAEESSLILSIGNWVLKESCSAYQQWNREGFENICISINLSVKQFKDRMFVPKIETIFSEFDINLSNIHLEITETCLVDDFNETTNKLQKLNQQGLHFSIDDFGTGYSSLHYLKDLPIKILKIDRIFISDLNKNSKNKSLVNAIITMAHNLELSVIAEGVETEEQFQLLKDMNCDYYQGHYFSPAVPLHQFITLLQDKNKKYL